MLASKWFGSLSIAPVGLVLAVLCWGCDSDTLVSIPPLGTLVITTVSTGSNLDADGYLLVVEGPSLNVDQAIGANGSVTFSIVTSGDYTIELNDVAANCSVDSSPQVASVAVGSESTITFNVSCT